MLAGAIGSIGSIGSRNNMKEAKAWFAIEPETVADVVAQPVVKAA